MLGLKILLLIWMSMGLSCTTRRKQRLCKQAGEILDNGSFKPLNERKRKYVCRSDFVSNIPDLKKLTFTCKIEKKSKSYEWEANLTRVDSLYLRNVTCERKKKCSDPPFPRNMTREITKRYLISISSSNDKEAANDFYTGDSLKYSCKPGFTLLRDLETSAFFNGDDFGDYNNIDDKSPQLTTTAAPVIVSVLKDITCDAEGFWNGYPDSQLYFGECQAIQCDASVFADISDGYISNFKETYEFLDEMKLECKDGYRHKGGVKSALCMTPSSFSNAFLTRFGCERIKCIELESPGNGYLKIDHNYVNGTVNYECESGYDLIGYPVWKCQSNGEWDHDCVKCAHKDAYCPPPCLPPGAMSKTSSGRYQMGDVLEFTCKSGKYYGGSTNRTCMKNRYWSGTPIDCTGTSLVDLRVGIELVSALKQISQNRTKSDTAIPKTINVWDRKGVDMYLLVDISKVETPEKMNETLSFVYALLPELGINDGDTGTRLALTFFGTKPYRMFEHHIKSDEVEGPFKSYEDVIKELGHYNKTSELHTIKQVTKDGTEIGAALKDIYEQIKTKRKGQKHRRDRISQQVLIVISDGRLTSTDDPTDLSLSLKEDFDVEIYSIAIGDLRDTKGLETMRKLASQIENEQHFFKISTDESNFKLVMSSMINKDCLNVSCGSTKPNLTCISNASENRLEVNAKKNAWPWMADLRTLHSHECGGSVINDQWILTAAHCFDHKSVTKVHLGKKALNGTDGYDEYHIATIHKHDNYNNKTKKYDIALVRLSQKINRKLELLPVCLWDKTIQDETRVIYEKLFTKTYGVVTGWGKTNSKSKLSDTLKQMQMEVKSSEECLENLTSKEKDHISTSLMFCAGGNEIVDGKTQIVDTCQGDSGGPFVVRHPVDERKFIQTGIVSFGFGCKQMGKYGFYTKLTEELLGWINDTIEKVEKKAPQEDRCLKIKNGNVHKSNGYYVVSCDKGFSFNTIEQENKRANCIDGKLKSIVVGQEPRCIPDRCKVPYEFDTRLSISDKYHIFLSGGSVVEVGDFVYINCSQVGDDMYEPVNRRFKCINGQWIEDEQNKLWKFGNNGFFPKCRKTKCEPNCENGGVCLRDDQCKCKYLTSGKRCENVICDDKCYANNGECVGPGKCKCPEGKYGANCEQQTINVRKNQGIDVYLLVDVATSITLEMMNRTFNILFTLLPQLGINDGDTGTRLALTVFGSKWLRIFDKTWDDFNDFNRPFKSYIEVEKEIESLMNKEELMTIRLRANADLWRTIRTALDDVYFDIGTKLVMFRQGVLDRYSKQVLITISDGGFTTMDDPTNSALRLKSEFDVEIYSIAIGDQTDTTGIFTMRNLASQIENEQHFFHIRDDESVFDMDWGSILNIGSCKVPEIENMAKLNTPRTYYGIGETVSYFTCSPGHFLSSDKGMTCQNNGTWSDVVTCVKAKCELNCENGGVCLRDDQCKCKNLTSGKRCENVICDDKCYANNGECVGPGKCKCPEGKLGANCEQATACPALSRIQNDNLLQDQRNGFSNNYEDKNEYTCDKGKCIKQVEGEIIRLAKHRKRPSFELLHYACNFTKANYAVRVRIKEVTYNENTQMTALGIVMANLNQGKKSLTQGNEMLFHSTFSCQFQELEKGKTYIIIGKDGSSYRDDEGHDMFLYPLMGTTLVMEYISPQQYRVDRRNYRILYKVQSNFERLMLGSGCQHK